MVEEMLNYLQKCSTKVLSSEEWFENQGLLIVPAYNLLVKFEEVCDEYATLSDFVQQQLQELHNISIDDAWRKIGETNLFPVELELSVKQKRK